MNKKVTTLLFVVLTVTAFSQKKPFDLYLLTGQSNMAGRGTVESQDTVAHPRVFSLNKENEWVPARDPIHFDKPVAGVGPGRSFGIEMAKANPGAIIGLIPCAVGGSAIDDWRPGVYFEQTKNYPWDDMEKRLKIAMKNGRLKGIIWHQGESDSNPGNSAEYEQKLEKLINRLRTLADDPDVPFVAGEIGRFNIKTNKEQYPDIHQSPAEVVMKSTKDVVNHKSNAAFVKSGGLKDRGDKTHFNSESYRILGKRYAKAMQKLQKK